MYIFRGLISGSVFCFKYIGNKEPRGSLGVLCLCKRGILPELLISRAEFRSSTPIVIILLMKLKIYKYLATN